MRDTFHINAKTFISIFILLNVAISACGPGNLLGPTLTPTYTNTPTPTNTPTITPTYTPTPTLSPTPTNTPTITPTYTPTPTLSPTPTEGLPDLFGIAITVAVEDAWPPFNYVDEDSGDSIGWDYDVVREICDRINCVPEFKLAAWDGIFPAMLAGEFDMLADGVTVTEERAKIIDYSIPYVTIGQVLLVREGEKASVDDIKADPDALIGTQIGTKYEIVAKNNFTEEQVQSFEDFGAATLALMAGDVDGVVIDTVSAVGFMGENLGEMKVIGALTSDEQLAFVFPPGSDLQHSINLALESMKADGTLGEFNKKWGLVFIPSRIINARMSSDYDGNITTTVFDQDDVFYFVAELVDARKDTIAKAIWTAVDVEGFESNFYLDETELTTSADSTLHFDLSNTYYWPIGKYKVDLYLNGVLNISLEFQVEA